MKSWLRVCVLSMAAIVLNACGAIPVSTDYDPAWQMPADASYAWIKRPSAHVDPMIDNDLVAGRVHRAVDDQLAAKGLHAAADDQAAVLITYHIGEEEKLDISSFHSNFGYYPCWRCYGPGFDSDVWVNQYTEGKLIIDMVDAKTKQLVWRGIAARRVPTFKTPGERDTYIRETVDAIFKKFPAN
ncbi:MAG TPA: DUF4136 domain-containing protein [Spongiibacteraceae bacterium]|nr:DUF4136 domain-containing protein [Spongiibacteraceae bacterium]